MKMAHVTINTKDLNESLAFYRDIIGLRLCADLREAGKPIVFLSDAEGDTQIELIENAGEAYAGSGLSIGFHCSDVESARESLITKGYAPSPLVQPLPGVTFFFFPDPSGVLIQFIGE